MMHCDARALDLCTCITRDVPYDARMMHRDALMRLMHLGLGDAWCIKVGWLSVIQRFVFVNSPALGPFIYKSYFFRVTNLLD